MNEISIILMFFFGGVLLYAFRLTPGLGPREEQPGLSGYTLILLLFFLYFFFPGFMCVVFENSEFTWVPYAGGPESTAFTTTVITSALVIFVLSYRINLKPGLGRGASVFQLPTPLQYSLCFVLIALGVLLKIYFLAAAGGVEASIMRSSRGTSEVMGLDRIDPFLDAVRTLSGIGDAGTAWLFATSMARRKGRLLTFALYLGVAALTYSNSGKRLYLLWPLLVIVLSMHTHLFRIRLRMVPLLIAAGFGFGFISMMARVYLPATFSGAEINLTEITWAEGSLWKFYANSLEFASYELVGYVLQFADEVIYLLDDNFTAFVRTNIEPFVYFIPRIVWPEKPDFIIDYAHALTVATFGGDIDRPDVGINATLIGTSWGLFGPVGLLFAMILQGWMCAATDNKFLMPAKPSVNQIVFFAFALTVIFHTFRQGTLAWVVIICVMQQFGILLGFSLIALAGILRAERPAGPGLATRPLATPRIARPM